jgi:MFS family permease
MTAVTDVEKLAHEQGIIMEKPRWYNYLTINAFWLGLTTISQTNALIIPLLIQNFVGIDRQGKTFGQLRLYTLMVALLFQALMGMLSDQSPLRWGRRRPFILVGALLNILCMIALGASTSYRALLIAALCAQAVINIAHAAQQGLIPDLVPKGYRGRFSAVKAIMELLPVIIVALTVGKLVADGNIWGGILVANGILFLCMLVTMCVKERPREQPPQIDWKPFGRLFLMTIIFTVIILGMGKIVDIVGALIAVGESVSELRLVIGMSAAGVLTMSGAIVLGIGGSILVGIGRNEMQKNPSFTWWTINRLAFLVGVNNLSTFAVYFIQARLGLAGTKAAEPAANLMLVVGVMILIAALPSGWLSDQIGKKKLVIASGIIAAIGTAILLISPSMEVLYLGGGFVGLATGMFYTTNWALGTNIVPQEKAASYLGVSNLAGAGAGAIGAYIGGPIADYFAQTAQSPSLGYLILFAIFGAMFLLSTTIVFKVDE